MKKKFKIIVDKLIESYPDARCELEYKSPFQLLIATILSAQTIGLYRMKSKNIINLCRILEERFDSEVPRTRDELITLPGVGRKTANVVISNCFGVQAFAVDVHVFRVSNRIGIANSPTPEKTELDLMKNIDENLWTICHHTIIFHGRRCCTSRKPNCGECKISEYCKYYKQNN